MKYTAVIERQTMISESLELQYRAVSQRPRLSGVSCERAVDARRAADLRGGLQRYQVIRKRINLFVASELKFSRPDRRRFIGPLLPSVLIVARMYGLILFSSSSLLLFPFITLLILFIFLLLYFSYRLHLLSFHYLS